MKLLTSHIKKYENKIFDKLSYERIDEIKDLSRQIDFNNLIYYFKSKDVSPIKFIGFKAPLYLYRNILNGNTKLEKAEEYQKQFKSTLLEITRENSKKKSKGQIKTIKKIKNLYKSRESYQIV